MNRKSPWLKLVLALPLLALAGCAGEDEGAAPAAAEPCTVAELEDGSAAIRCPDGSEVVVAKGRDGADGQDGSDGADGADGAEGQKGDKGEGAACTLGRDAQGKETLTCGGQTVTIGDPCEDGFYGHVYLNDDADPNSRSNTFTLFQVTNCTRIRGDLKIVGFDGETLPKALSRVEQIDGHLWVGMSGSLAAFAFPSLVEVGGDVVIQENPLLSTLDGFPLLEIVGGMLSVVKNPQLLTVGDFPALEGTGSVINFWDNSKLASIGSFPQLVINGGLTWEDNPLLVDLGNFPVVEFALWVYVAGNDALVSLPTFPALTDTGWLDILENPELRSIEGLAALAFVGDKVRILDNPKLPQCHVDQLLSGVNYVAGTAEISGNDTTATCP